MQHKDLPNSPQPSVYLSVYQVLTAVMSSSDVSYTFRQRQVLGGLTSSEHQIKQSLSGGR